ncbi:MAG: hypothetical protein AAF220_01735 [Pseudomonadota bacterium]
MFTVNLLDTPDQEFSVFVDRARLTIRVRYNLRLDRWTLDVSRDSVPLAQGIRMVRGVDLFLDISEISSAVYVTLTGLSLEPSAAAMTDGEMKLLFLTQEDNESLLESAVENLRDTIVEIAGAAPVQPVDRVADFALGGVRPSIVAQMQTPFYAIGDNTKSFSDLFTFARSGSAWGFQDGVLTEFPNNVPRLNNERWDGTQWVKEGLRLESEPVTNSLLWSRDTSQAPWSGSALGVLDAVGLDGVANTASTLRDTSTTAFGLAQYVHMIPVADSWHTVQAFFKLQPDAGDNVTRFTLQLQNGSDVERIIVYVRVADGGFVREITLSSVADAEYWITVHDGWCQVTLSLLASASNGNTALVAMNHPIWSDDNTSISNVALTGELVTDFWSIAEGWRGPHSPILTEGSAVVRSGEDLSIDASKFPTPGVDGASVAISGRFLNPHDGSSDITVFFNMITGNVRFQVRMDGDDRSDQEIDLALVSRNLDLEIITLDITNAFTVGVDSAFYLATTFALDGIEFSQSGGAVASASGTLNTPWELEGVEARICWNGFNGVVSSLYFYSSEAVPVSQLPQLSNEEFLL